jgi:hypothetical protein
MAYISLEPAFEMWIIPQLVLALLPPGIAFVITKGKRFSFPHACGFGGIMAVLWYLTSDGWAEARHWQFGDLLAWWWARGALVGGIVLTTSAGLTRLYYRLGTIRNRKREGCHYSVTARPRVRNIRDPVLMVPPGTSARNSAARVGHAEQRIDPENGWWSAETWRQILL